MGAAKPVVLNAEATELLRPWKLATLAAGLGLLIGGSFVYNAPDWDIPVSIIMAVVAYLTAPWCMRVLLERRWRAAPLALFLTWFAVDGCYALYWSAVNPRALELMRDANAPVLRRRSRYLWRSGYCGYHGDASGALAQALPRGSGNSREAEAGLAGQSRRLHLPTAMASESL